MAASGSRVDDVNIKQNKKGDKRRDRVYCSVYGCLNSTLIKPTLSFFSLPADAERRSEWLRLISREDLLPKAHKHRGYLVCEEHFAEHDILPGSRRKILKKVALPTQNLPTQPYFQKNDQETMPSRFENHPSHATTGSHILNSQQAELIKQAGSLTGSSLAIQQRCNVPTDTAILEANDQTNQENAFSSLGLQPRKIIPISDGEKRMAMTVLKYTIDNWPKEIKASRSQMLKKASDLCGISEKVLNKIVREYERCGKGTMISGLGSISTENSEDSDSGDDSDEDSSDSDKDDDIPSLALLGANRRHEGITCNACDQPVTGFRYTCVQCHFDMCSSCEAQQVHATHYVLRIPGPRPLLEISEMLQRVREEVRSIIELHQKPDDGEPVIKFVMQLEERQDPLKEDPGSGSHSSNMLEQLLLSIKDESSYAESVEIQEGVATSRLEFGGAAHQDLQNSREVNLVPPVTVQEGLISELPAKPGERRSVGAQKRAPPVKSDSREKKLRRISVAEKPVDGGMFTFDVFTHSSLPDEPTPDQTKGVSKTGKGVKMKR